MATMSISPTVRSARTSRTPATRLTRRGRLLLTLEQPRDHPVVIADREVMGSRHHTDVGGVRVKVHVKDVNLGRPAEQYLKITYSCRRVGEEPGCF